MALIIEFTGNAGSGKTYLADALANSLKECNCKVLRTGNVGNTKPLLYLMIQPKKILLSIYLFKKYCNIYKLQSWKFLSRWLMLQGRMSFCGKISKKQIVVLDEGFVHIFRGFRRLTDNKIALKNIYSKKLFAPLFKPLSDVYIYVNCTTGNLIKRLEKRGDIKNSKEISIIIEKYHEINKYTLIDLKYTKYSLNKYIIYINNNNVEDKFIFLNKIKKIIMNLT